MKKLKVFTILAGIAITGGMAAMIASLKNQITDLDRKQQKFRKYYAVLNSWMSLKLNKTETDVINCFLERGYRKIAIYGMGGIGQNLLKQLKNSEVEVLYGIDDCGGDSDEIDIYLSDDELEPVDAIIVTAMYDFEDIKNKLENNTTSEIVSLEEIF